MSRIGKLPVIIPAGVNVTIDGTKLSASGPKGNLELSLSREIKIEQNGDQLVISKARNSAKAQQQYGLSRTLVANLVQGVHEGFKKVLEIQGVGYRVQASGSKLTLALGYSHPIEHQLPAGVEAAVEGTTITLESADN